ncbi:MAG: ABC transporter permease, partial [Bacteroidales bacterium]|nr:ABC transporter permease [Bacteroidales bacterium]
MRKLQMAWRNLWRNKRRTFITIASIFFGVLIATTMSSMQEGTFGNMIDMSVKLSSGYFQVQHPDFNENKSINNVFSIPDNLDQTLQDIPEITVISKRLQSFALLSSGLTTRGGIVLGIDPDKDRLISNFQNWISEGEFLKPNDRSVLLTYNIAKHLKIGVND